MLSENQTQWIFETCRKVTNKYIKRLPMDDKGWHEFVQELKKIENSARHDKLTVELLLAVSKYMEQEGKRLRKESE